VHNRFEGVIHHVRFDLADVADPGTDEGRERAVMVHQ
jgi:arylsulfatase